MVAEKLEIHVCVMFCVSGQVIVFEVQTRWLRSPRSNYCARHALNFGRFS